MIQNRNALNGETTAFAEICKEGVISDASLVIHLKPYAVDISPRALKNPDYFIPGKYRLSLIFNEHEFLEKGKD